MTNPVTASEARANLYRLIDETNESHRPVVITGKCSSAVLVSAEDWDGMRSRRRCMGLQEGTGAVRVLRLWTHYE